MLHLQLQLSRQIRNEKPHNYEAQLQNDRFNNCFKINENSSKQIQIFSNIKVNIIVLTISNACAAYRLWNINRTPYLSIPFQLKNISFQLEINVKVNITSSRNRYTPMVDRSICMVS